ncbi:MAG: hypothetical protein MMC33_010913, partial [Icmadophila ericetorum]|nr:hypothetical protein [Icmadophila ericetorum]
MALDIYSVPTMSDAPERLFSMTGDTISPRRRLLKSETIQWLMSLKSWINEGLIEFTGNTVPP